MEWADEGVILSVRPHGETAAIAEVLTRAHGRCSGLIYGGRSKRLRAVLQLGNHVDAIWKARLSEQLGHFTLELRTAHSLAAMDDPAALVALTSLAMLAREVPERDPHPNLYEVTQFVLSFLDDGVMWPALMVRWELALLNELGFGLDLTQCAATGATDDLIYVSPRTGRAVSRGAGEPYKLKLLALPPFLRGPTAGVRVTADDLAAGFALTGHFLVTRIYAPRGDALPAPRLRLPAAVRRQAKNITSEQAQT